MPDPAPAGPGDDIPAYTRRGRRIRRVKARRQRIVAGVIAVVLLIGLALLATETVRFSGGAGPILARAAHSQPDAVTSSTAPGRPCRSPLTVANPLRLWVGGDSLAGSLGPALGAIAGATGVVQPYFDSRVSSGLTNPSFFNWPAQATKEMARLNPEIAVFIIGANDFLAPASRPPTTSTTTSTTSSTEPWKVDYIQRVEAMLKTLSAPGRTVIWVGPPPFNKERKSDNDGVRLISEVSQEVIARHPEAIFVDDYKLFVDANGKYAAQLPDANGKLVLMRTGDGVHFTAEGGKRLGRAVFRLINTQCYVESQAVPGATLPTIQTAGSTLVAPGSAEHPGEPIATTPPATDPTTTTVRGTKSTTTTTPTTTTPTTTTPVPPPPTTAPPPTTTTKPHGKP